APGEHAGTPTVPEAHAGEHSGAVQGHVSGEQAVVPASNEVAPQGHAPESQGHVPGEHGGSPAIPDRGVLAPVTVENPRWGGGGGADPLTQRLGGLIGQVGFPAASVVAEYVPVAGVHPRLRPEVPSAGTMPPDYGLNTPKGIHLRHLTTETVMR